MDVEIIKDFFSKELNVALEEEWLAEVVAYLLSLGWHSDSLLSAVYEQWLYTDLKISTKPLLSLSANSRSAQAMLAGNIAVQINSIVDIGTSFYSQYKNLTSKFEDNSGFQLKSEENGTNSDIFLSTKRMLSMEITDGQVSMKAVEYGPLSALSILTCPGCKILLTNNTCLRRGILLLTELNCIILGGDDDSLMKTGRPVEVMMKQLNIAASLQRHDITSLSKLKEENNHKNTSSSNNVFSQSNTKPVMQVKPLSGKKPSESTRRKLMSTSETEQYINNIKQRTNVSLNVSPASSNSKTSVTASTSRQTRNDTSSHTHTPLIKRLKIEAIDDDADVILLPTPTKQEIREDDTSSKNSLTKTPKCTDDPVIVAYKRLGVESIAEALRTMRYAVGPRRKMLAAIMDTKPVEPLHISNDGLWALSVTLSDETYEKLTCLVSHEFLVELIGWTPNEALDARLSKDPARRKEGTLRTRSAGQSMRRLDLIWEVEFFPPGGFTPIIHKIDTYAQKFGLIR